MQIACMRALGFIAHAKQEKMSFWKPYLQKIKMKQLCGRVKQIGIFTVLRYVKALIFTNGWNWHSV